MSQRANLIESKLLSRCRTFEKNLKVIETLEKRYSANGDQKNFLVLKATKGKDASEDTKSVEVNSLLHEIKNYQTDRKTKLGNNKYNATKTRNEFKLFINQNLKIQKRMGSKLKKNPSLKVEQLVEFDKLLKFEDFIHLNDLWNEYIKSLILQINRPLDKLVHSDVTLMLSKLTSADLIGAFVTVVSSLNTTLVGMAGIVIWESQHNFVIVVPRQDNWKCDVEVPQLQQDENFSPSWSISERIGGLKIILKLNTIFQVQVALPNGESGPVNFDIIGNRFNIKSFERANKKFKNHNVDDIVL